MKKDKLKQMAKANKFLLDKNIPAKADKSIAVIEYDGFIALVPIKSLQDGSFRGEFIKQTGVPLPANTKVPNDVPEYFCPNVHKTKEVIIE